MAEDRSAGVVIDEGKAKPPLTATASQLSRLLDVIKDDILPVTEKGVAAGNKVFGGAVLDDAFQTVIAETNTETTCPLFHGEVKLIYEWSKIVPPKLRGPAAQSAVFLATHEPCCMCISSILWSGFTRVFYFFPYASTAAQGIPHDINTMHELWGVNTYRKRNKYLTAVGIMDLIDALEEGPEKAELQAKSDALVEAYDTLSNKYHSEKALNENNSLVLG